MPGDELAALDGLLMRLKMSQREQERGPGGTLGEKLHSLSQRMLHDFTMLKEEAAKVVNDAHLSGEGKRARLGALATKHNWSYLEEVRTETKASRDRLATLLFSSPTSKEDPVLSQAGRSRDSRRSQRPAATGNRLDVFQCRQIRPA